MLLKKWWLTIIFDIFDKVIYIKAMKKIFIQVFFFLFFIPLHNYASDTIRITTHKKTIVQTNPSRGFNNYQSVSIFPDYKHNYRRINLSVTLQCPDGLMCGEWDYSDGIYIVPHSGEFKADTLEIARILTPYGRFYNEDWKFTFRSNISDFSTLLHDTVTVIYKHTGYEPANDRGWKLTIDFDFILGTPAIECQKIIPLWNGNYSYGNPKRSIEEDLTQKAIQTDKNSYLIRLWLIQTGHGMDLKENCAEFCYKKRSIYFNQKLINQRVIKKECASNPLYHQAGTWIYDRANWCPGDMPQPECFNVFIHKDNEKIFNIDMEPYIADTGEVTAVYSFCSYAFVYKKPKHKDDVSIERVISPSADDMFSNVNPNIHSLKFEVRNNGNSVLRNLIIHYGFEKNDLKTYYWSGCINPCHVEEISIMTNINQSGDFLIMLDKPNGRKDQYPDDNIIVSTATGIPVYPDVMILSYKTNNDTAHNSFLIRNIEGKTIFERKAGELKLNQIYNDTINLIAGFYELKISDTAGDGLEFWANPEGGMGYFRILTPEGKIVKVFQADFGNEIRQVFQVKENNQDVVYAEEDYIVLYPQRTKGQTALYFLMRTQQDINLAIKSTEGKELFNRKLENVKEFKQEFDFGFLNPGIYIIELLWENQIKKIRMKIIE